MVVDLEEAQKLAQEMPAYRHRLREAGLFRTDQAMQTVQDRLATELEAALLQEGG